MHLNSVKHELHSFKPALREIAVSRPRLIFSVQTLAPNPYLVLLARAMASLGVRKVMTAKTGPNI